MSLSSSSPMNFLSLSSFYALNRKYEGTATEQHLIMIMLIKHSKVVSLRIKQTERRHPSVIHTTFLTLTSNTSNAVDLRVQATAAKIRNYAATLENQTIPQLLFYPYCLHSQVMQMAWTATAMHSLVSHSPYPPSSSSLHAPSALNQLSLLALFFSSQQILCVQGIRGPNSAAAPPACSPGPSRFDGVERSCA